MEDVKSQAHARLDVIPGDPGTQVTIVEVERFGGRLEQIAPVTDRLDLEAAEEQGAAAAQPSRYP